MPMTYHDNPSALCATYAHCSHAASLAAAHCRCLRMNQGILWHKVVNRQEVCSVDAKSDPQKYWLWLNQVGHLVEDGSGTVPPYVADIGELQPGCAPLTALHCPGKATQHLPHQIQRRTLDCSCAAEPASTKHMQNYGMLYDLRLIQHTSDGCEFRRLEAMACVTV